MAKAPLPVETLIDRYGPHLNYVPPGGWRDESRHRRSVSSKRIAAFVDSNAGFNSRPAATRSSVSSRGRNFLSTTGCFARKA
jgi:hypothetical protein